MEIRIDTVRLQVSGMDPATARQFGRQLGEHLAVLLSSAPPASGAARLTRLRVSVPGAAGRRPGSLAPALAAEISRALRTATAGAETAGAGTSGAEAAARAVPASSPGPAAGPGSAAGPGAAARPGAAR